MHKTIQDMDKPGLNRNPARFRRPVTLIDRRAAYLTEDEEKEIQALMRKLFPGLSNSGTRPSQSSDSDPESLTVDDIDSIIDDSFDKYADKAKQQIPTN